MTENRGERVEPPCFQRRGEGSAPFFLRSFELRAPSAPWPELGAEDVHVWAARVDLEEAHLGGVLSLLDRVERRRADRRKGAHRARFAASHAALRMILGAYATRPPDALEFVEGPHGKPGLLPLAGPPTMGSAGGLTFNLSHSGCLALVAVARARGVGVDVEETRPHMDVIGVAERFFPPAQSRRVKELEGDDRVSAFFSIWTRLEASVKATGMGLSLPLDQVEILPGGGSGFRVRFARRGVPAVLSLADLPVGLPYHAALAAEGEGCNCAGFVWDWEAGAPGLREERA